MTSQTGQKLFTYNIHLHRPISQEAKAIRQ